MVSNLQLLFKSRFYSIMSDSKSYKKAGIAQAKLANGKTIILIANNGGKLQAFVQNGKNIPL